MDNQYLQSKKELILNTARQLLTKNGYAKTTLDDIANVLGMKKSSLYYYYQNKEALLEDVIKFEKEKYLQLINKAFLEGETTIDKIINYEKKKFEYVKSVVKLQDISLNVFFEIKNKIYNLIKEIHEKDIQLIAKTLEEGMKKKEIKKCDTKRIAELILTISEALRHREFYFASFTVDKTVDFTKAQDDMIFAVRLIFNGLLIK